MVTKADWTNSIGYASAVLAVTDVFTLWYRSHVSRPMSVVVDESAINAIDEALASHFGL
jgi:hypothetical protein